MKKSNSGRTSSILLGIANHKELKGEITFQRILQALGERVFGIALIFFALPIALPFSFIPGVSFVFSVPILLFACQMIFARKTLWLPPIIAKRTIHHKSISKIVHSFVPYLIRVEYFLKPRWTFMTNRPMEIITGSVIFCLAMFLMLPIPFSNFIFAIVIIIFGLGLIEKDGFLIVLGHLVTVIYMSFIYLIIMAAIKRLMT
ncbi:sugar transporter [Legionella norrlandica]|uniref:Sugar transporter n=1 Tax=Legionella norrlandica TaxID=1498499 RepID=A0A0A2T4Z7_9GAMM|nr:exopolysaccharide biosynthesis protein [Legionella norrlandica]KGP62493.1 sugar transporter [Legionella norrlandica]